MTADLTSPAVRNRPTFDTLRQDGAFHRVTGVRVERASLSSAAARSATDSLVRRSPGLLAGGQLDLRRLGPLVGHLVQEVRDTVQAGAALVVGLNHVPGADLRVRGGEHGIAGAGIVVPTTVRLKVHRAELPYLARVLRPVLEAASLFFLADLEPVLYDLDPASDECLLHLRHKLQKPLVLLSVANPMTRSTPARLYQERSNRQTSPPAGNRSM